MPTAIAAIAALLCFIIGLLLGKLLEQRRSIPKREAEARLAAQAEFYRATAQEARRQREEFQQLLQEQYRRAAQELLAKEREELQRQNALGVSQLLKPYSDRLAQYSTEITALKTTNEQLRGEMKSIGADAAKLSQALAGSKSQGLFGERTLENILSASGLTENVNFFLQKALRNDAGALIHSDTTAGGSLIPDALVRLPENGAMVIVDSKASFKAYLEAVNSEIPDARAALLEAHCKSLAAHIKELAQKNYPRAYRMQSTDNVVEMTLMFVPSDAALQAALDLHPELWKSAFDKGVILVAPGNLLLTLKLVELAWRRVELNQNTAKILNTAAMLLEDIADFNTKFEDAAAHLDKAREAMNKARNRLAATPTGKGYSIADAARTLVKLGAGKD